MTALAQAGLVGPDGNLTAEGRRVLAARVVKVGASLHVLAPEDDVREFWSARRGAGRPPVVGDVPAVNPRLVDAINVLADGGTVTGTLMEALRASGLVDPDGRPTDAGQALTRRQEAARGH
jgi:hypothetical protein